MTRTRSQLLTKRDSHGRVRVEDALLLLHATNARDAANGLQVELTRMTLCAEAAFARATPLEFIHSKSVWMQDMNRTC